MKVIKIYRISFRLSNRCVIPTHRLDEHYFMFARFCSYIPVYKLWKPKALSSWLCTDCLYVCGKLFSDRFLIVDICLSLMTIFSHFHFDSGLFLWIFFFPQCMHTGYSHRPCGHFHAFSDRSDFLTSKPPFHMFGVYSGQKENTGISRCPGMIKAIFRSMSSAHRTYQLLR